MLKGFATLMAFRVAGGQMTKIRRFSESLPMLLLRARETTLSRFRPILHQHGLTEPQWRALRALDDLGELTAAGLAAECSILAPSITRILKRLTEQGYVSTSRSRADQRELKVRMTVKGRRLVELVYPQLEQQYSMIRDQLKPEYLTSLFKDLQRLIDIGESERET